MSDLNITMIAGNLTADPILRTAGTRHITEATLANNEEWTDAKTGVQKERTSFIGLIGHGHSARTLATFGKGDRIYIVGKLIQEETAPGPRGGAPKSKTKVRVVRALREPIPAIITEADPHEPDRSHE